MSFYIKFLLLGSCILAQMSLFANITPDDLWYYYRVEKSMDLKDVLSKTDKVQFSVTSNGCSYKLKHMEKCDQADDFDFEIWYGTTDINFPKIKFPTIQNGDPAIINLGKLYDISHKNGGRINHELCLKDWYYAPNNLLNCSFKRGKGCDRDTKTTQVNQSDAIDSFTKEFEKSRLKRPIMQKDPTQIFGHRRKLPKYYIYIKVKNVRKNKLQFLQFCSPLSPNITVDLLNDKYIVKSTGNNKLNPEEVFKDYLSTFANNKITMRSTIRQFIKLDNLEISSITNDDNLGSNLGLGASFRALKGSGHKCTLSKGVSSGKLKVLFTYNMGIFLLSKDKSNIDAIVASNPGLTVQHLNESLHYLKYSGTNSLKFNLEVDINVDKNGPFFVSYNDLVEGPLWSYGPSNLKKSLVCSHRGFNRKPGVPENSILAFEYAIYQAARRGKDIDIIELDIARAADGKFILLHDGMGRTTDYRAPQNPFVPTDIHYAGPNVIKDGATTKLSTEFASLHYRDRFWNPVPDINIHDLENILRYFQDRQHKGFKECLQTHFKSIYTKYNSLPNNPHKELWNDKYPQMKGGVKVVIALDKIAGNSTNLVTIYNLAKTIAGKNPNGIHKWLMYKFTINSRKGIKSIIDEIKNAGLSKEEIKDIFLTPILKDDYHVSSKVPISASDIETITSKNIIDLRTKGYIIPAIEMFVFNPRSLKNIGSPKARMYFDPASSTYTNIWLGATMLYPVNGTQFGNGKIVKGQKPSDISAANLRYNHYNSMDYNIKNYYNYFITDTYDFVLDYLISLKQY